MAVNDNGNRRPQPMRLCMLDQVHQQEAGSKIRFLGCVHAYQMETGTLFFRTEYPAKKLSVPTVAVKLDNVLESMKHELTEVGAWLNIVGIVQPSTATSKKSRTSASGKERRPRNPPIVSATMIWSAGAIKKNKYESAARAYQKTIPSPG